MTIACLINIALNFILVPLWGYQAAAWTTLFSYVVLYLWFYIRDSIKYLNIKLVNRLIPAFIILFVQLGLDLSLRMVFQLNINEWLTIAEGVFFLAVYLFLNRKHINSIVYLFKN
jgi:O-antigen/teichoic acid export membrane protein